MSEVTTPRLMAAAKEFNIGKDTLVDFLTGKGFSKDDLKPTSKLTEDMYRSLQQEFQSDKVAKIKSDQIDLPRGGTVEAKKKRDEEEIVFKKEVKKVTKEEKPAPAPAPTPALEVKAPEPVEEKREEKKAEPPVENVEAPEIAGPKIVDKIDLSAIDSSTRPKKSSKKTEDTKPEPKEETEEPKVEPVTATKEEQAPVEEVEAEPVAQKEEKPKKEKAKPEPVAEQPVIEEAPQVEHQEEEEIHASPLIENIKADKLEGPKILGKIQLPVSSDTRPKQLDEKRKRKRIPVEKRGDVFNRQQGPGQGTGQQRPNQGFQGQRPGGPQQGQPPRPYQGQQGGRPAGPGGPNAVPRRGPTIQKAGTGPKPPIRREVKEIDAKEIQDKIRETQAKLSGGGGRGKSLKAKYRRAKREEMAAHG